MPARIVSGDKRPFRARAGTLDVEEEGTQEKFPKGARLKT